MTALVFDFDGTIADTLGAITNISNRLAPQFGIPPATEEDIQAYKNLSAEELVRHTDISLLKLLRLLRRVRKELQAEIPQLDLIPQMGDTLSRLAKQGQPMGIVTSNSADNVRLFLEVHQLDAYFHFVHTGASLFGKSRVLRKVLRQQGLDPAKVLYVGDETRDVDASHQVGMAVAAVTWGFNSRQALERHKPDFLLTRPEELLRVVEIRSTL